MGNKIEKMACPHCGNDNINEMLFDTVDYVDPRHKQNPMLSGYSYEWKPKTPIGFHFKCSKCGKDTFIIFEAGKYGNIEWGEDIPQQIIFTPIFKQPEFSATTYIMHKQIKHNGFLDQIVVTNQNLILSLITREIIQDDGTWDKLSEETYFNLKMQGIREVGYNEQSNDEHVNESTRTTSTGNDEKMGGDDTNSEITGNAENTKHEYTGKKSDINAKRN